MVSASGHRVIASRALYMNTVGDWAYDEIFIEVKSILADVKIRVPQNAIVHLDSNPVLGSVSEDSATFGGPADPPTGPPKTFHIQGTAILGEIKIKRGPRLTKRLRLT